MNKMIIRMNYDITIKTIKKINKSVKNKRVCYFLKKMHEYLRLRKRKNKINEYLNCLNKISCNSVKLQNGGLDIKKLDNEIINVLIIPKYDHIYNSIMNYIDLIMYKLYTITMSDKKLLCFKIDIYINDINFILLELDNLLNKNLFVPFKNDEVFLTRESKIKIDKNFIQNIDDLCINYDNAIFIKLINIINLYNIIINEKDSYLNNFIELKKIQTNINKKIKFFIYRMIGYDLYLFKKILNDDFCVSNNLKTDIIEYYYNNIFDLYNMILNANKLFMKKYNVIKILYYFFKNLKKMNFDEHKDAYIDYNNSSSLIKKYINLFCIYKKNIDVMIDKKNIIYL